jgi:2-dehydro-3-deoxygalactonokinase
MITVDWGTSSLRAYLLDGAGAILERRSAAAGITTIKDGAFAPVLAAAIAGWPADALVVLSGMIGSRQGWREAPYVPCPAGLAEIAAALLPMDDLAGRRTVLIPGLSHRDGDGPDVMRGEETQAMGLMVADGRICLPGTHSKWARLEGGNVTGFRTYLTGELFAALTDHTIVGRLMPPAEPEPVEWRAGFDRGIDRAQRATGLLSSLFGVRATGLLGDLPLELLRPFLSGLLIGSEFREAAPPPSQTLTLVGSEALALRYGRAADRLGIPAKPAQPDLAAFGAFRIAQAAGLPTS